jgi:hypothetical protein
MKDYAEGRGYLNEIGRFIFHRPRPTVVPSWGWAVIIGLALAGALYAAGVRAQANNAGECGLVADMVLTAAALEKRGIDQEKRAGVMEDAYAVLLGGGDAKRWRDIMERSVRFVKRDAARAVAPADLAAMVNEGCNMHRGNLREIFGSDV